MADLQEGVSVVTVGRTAPIPPGPQLAKNSLPVVIASDQEAVPVEVQNQQISEVSLSLLGIPRAEVALGIFADVTTYDINPNEWQSEGPGTVTHIASESAAKVSLGTAVTNSYEILSSKRFFRYQPGRVSAATFGVRVNTTTDITDIKKFGAFDKKDGYYVEVQGGGQTAISDQETNLYCVRRTSALESNESGIRTPNTVDGDRGTAGTDLVIVRAGLTYIHAALFDRSLRGSGNNIGSNASSSGAATVAASFLVVPNEYRYTYEYRVPRKYFSHDRLDGQTRTQYYSDRTPGRSSFTVSIGGTADSPSVSYGNSTVVTDDLGNVATKASVWSIDFSKVTMYKVEYSWYGAVGGHFLAYVPDATTAGEARWVRIHHVRASNQLTSPSLSNPTLPISYLVQKATSGNENSLYKYGASYYIDGGDKGTIVARSQSNTADRSVTTSTSMLLALRTRSTIGASSIRNRMQVYPTRLGVGTDARTVIRLIKNPTTVSGTPTFTVADTLSPIEYSLSTSITAPVSGITVATFFVGAGGVDIDLAPYFGYNKDYLSYPLTATTGDTLYVFAQAVSGTVNTSGALTWEEQV
ncbi:hypothetical protein CCP3SC1AL1_170002 [Gammaproteobacteria bacterium]